MKVFSIKLEETSIFLFLLIVVWGVFYTWHKEQQITPVMLPVNSKTIVIDAGHGGWDPGRTGINGKDEKDINLDIASHLQMYLEQGGATVIITRNGDEALSIKKREDMKGRKEIVNESGGDILISIHQNFYPKESVKGAQVFYHNGSKESEKLAQNIQDSLKKYVDENNKRVIKANTDYYMLKTTDIPAVIVECGFLNNTEEERKLNTKEYQEKVAWGVYMGIMEYFKEPESV